MQIVRSLCMQHCHFHKQLATLRSHTASAYGCWMMFTMWRKAHVTSLPLLLTSSPPRLCGICNIFLLICVFERVHVWHFKKVEPRQRDLQVCFCTVVRCRDLLIIATSLSVHRLWFGRPWSFVQDGSCCVLFFFTVPS